MKRAGDEFMPWTNPDSVEIEFADYSEGADREFADYSEGADMPVEEKEVTEPVQPTPITIIDETVIIVIEKIVKPEEPTTDVVYDNE